MKHPLLHQVLSYLRPRLTLLERYLLREFLTVFGVSLTASVALFLIFDLFERMRIFVKEGTKLSLAITYMALKVPLIVHLMVPVAVLVAVLLSVGRLSQSSELTAMRACGAAVWRLVRPLLLAGIVISITMFVLGETIVPWASERVEEIYHFDIKKKLEKGSYSRANFWYRDDNTFYNIGYYDSRTNQLSGISIFEFDNNFILQRRIDAQRAAWNKSLATWTMSEVAETTFDEQGKVLSTYFKDLPLLIEETPTDFYQVRRAPETMSFTELRKHIAKLRAEGVPVTSYMVDLYAKTSFPFVSGIIVLIAFPFGMIPARSGSLTSSFIAGVSLGFGYYFVHAFCVSLGSGELLPALPAAWSANILLMCLGGYLMAGAERA